MKNILRSKLFHTLLGLAVSGGLILWLALSMDWRQVWYHLSHAHYWALFPSLVILTIHFIIRATRWTYLLPEGEKTPLGLRLDAIMIGNLATYVLPLRAGEFIRPLIMSKESSYSYPVVFISVVLERFFDLASVLFLFGAFLSQLPNIPSWAAHGAEVLAVIAAGILVFLVAACLIPAALKSFMNLVLSFFPDKISTPLLRIGDDLIRGAQVLHDFKRMSLVIIFSILTWGSCILSFYVYLWFTDVTPSFSLATALTVIVALAVAAPSAPGFIGVFQTACVATFSLYHENSEQALAFAIIIHALQYLYNIAWGLVSILRRDLNLFSLLKEKEEASEAVI